MAMGDSRFRVFQIGFTALVLPVLVVLSGSTVVSAATDNGGANDETAARCNLDVSTFIPLPYSDTSNMVCKPDKGDLPLSNVPPYVVLRGATIYLAFQLNFSAPLARQPVLLAFGSKYPTKLHHLYPHDDKTTFVFDFSAGSVSVSAAPDQIGKLKRNHGILGLFGWGLFLPYGALAARYFKHRDPLWFYLHVGFQFVGFILGLAGVLVGLTLYNKINAHFPTHKGIGIFILALSILQILAFFLRPDKDSKIRMYWNWYHHWVGRIALFFGGVNIVLGIHIGNAGNQWKAGYGFLLGTVLVATIVLEVLSRRRRSETDTHPAFQMNTLQ